MFLLGGLIYDMLLFFFFFIFGCLNHFVTILWINAGNNIGIMARVLAQSIGMPGLLSGQRHGQHKGSGKSRRSLKMMSSLQMPALRMSSFSGLRTVNNLDLLSRSRRSLPSKMLTSTSSRRERAKRFVPRAMFERFTEKAIKVIMLAQEEARRLGHNFVGTEQILLGLIGEGTGIAAKVLKSMGINLKDARVEVEKIIGRGSGFVAVEIPFTPRAKRVLELSLEEARQLGKCCSVLFFCDYYYFNYNKKKICIA